MTSTLILTTLAGAAIGYPFLRQLAKIKEETLTGISRQGLWLDIFLALITGALTLSQHSWYFSFLVFAGMLVVGYVPKFIFPLLLTLFISLSFLNLGTMSAVAILILLLIVGRKVFISQYRFPTFSLRWSVVFGSIALLIAGFCLWAAPFDLPLASNPRLIASIGGQRAIPALVSLLNSSTDSSEIKDELHKIGPAAIDEVKNNFEKLNSVGQLKAAEFFIEQDQGAYLLKLGNDGIGSLIALATQANDTYSVSRHSLLAKNGVDSFVDLPGPIKNRLEMHGHAQSILIKSGKLALPHLFSAFQQRDLDDPAQSRILNIICRIGGVRVLPEVLPLFNSRPHRDGKLLTELRAFGIESIPYFVEAMKSDDEWQRWWARETLYSFGESAKSPVMALLKSEKAPTRADAIYLLGELKSHEAVPALVASLNDPKAREAAIWSLGIIEDDRAIPALIGAYRKDPNREILNSIGMINGAQAVSFLKETMRYGERGARFDALNILGQTTWTSGEKSQIPSYVNSLFVNTTSISQSAAEDLEKIGEPSILSFLIDADEKFHESKHESISNCKICHAIQTLKQ